MGRRNLKAVGLFDGVANTPNASSITDPFNGLSLEWFGLGSDSSGQRILASTDTTTTIPFTNTTGGFSFWIKLTADVSSYKVGAARAGVMALTSNASPNPTAYPIINVNIFTDGSNGNKVELEVATGSGGSPALTNLIHLTPLVVGQWYNIAITYLPVSGTQEIKLAVNGVYVSGGLNPNIPLFDDTSKRWVIGATNHTTTSGLNADYLGYAKLNHFTFYKDGVMLPTTIYNNGTPYYPTDATNGFQALYTVRANRGDITTDRLSPLVRDSALSSTNIDFYALGGRTLTPFVRLSKSDFVKTNNQFTRSLERFHTWADTTTAIDGSKAFSASVANGMFMRPAYLPFQTGIGINTPATSTVGAIDKQITSFSNFKPMTASYVDDWPNAPSVFGGSGSMYRKAHENTYPTKTIGSITVNNYKAASPTKDYFTPSFS